MGRGRFVGIGVGELGRRRMGGGELRGMLEVMRGLKGGGRICRIDPSGSQSNILYRFMNRKQGRKLLR